MAVAYLERRLYTFPQVDDVLGLTIGTARRWIDGYERAGREYPPVVRDERTGDEIATWGEFVETTLLAGYRDAGVQMLHLRPIVTRLRELYGVRYPLATLRPFVEEGERRLLYELQEESGLEESMRLVVEARSGQYVLAPPMASFKGHAEFESVDGSDQVVVRLRPLGLRRDVVIDPNKRSGSPVVRAVPTSVIAELVSAGDTVEYVAEQYELSLDQVLDALEFERQRRVA